MGEGPGVRSGFGGGLFVFYEASSPLPMGEGPGVRSGFGGGLFGFCFSDFVFANSSGRYRSDCAISCPNPKYFSKNEDSFSIISFFFISRCPPPNRDMRGMSLSISVPVVLSVPL